jgi:hypothetical protein
MLPREKGELMPLQAINTMLTFGWYLVNAGAHEQAEPLFRLALDSARFQEDTLSELAALQLLGQLALRCRNFVLAEQHFADLLRLSRRIGADYATASALHNHGELAMLRGDLSEAHYYFVIAANLYRAAGHQAGADRALTQLLAFAVPQSCG